MRVMRIFYQSYTDKSQPNILRALFTAEAQSAQRGRRGLRSSLDMECIAQASASVSASSAPLR